MYVCSGVIFPKAEEHTYSNIEKPSLFSLKSYFSIKMCACIVIGPVWFLSCSSSFTV